MDISSDLKHIILTDDDFKFDNINKTNSEIKLNHFNINKSLVRNAHTIEYLSGDRSFKKTLKSRHFIDSTGIYLNKFKKRTLDVD